MKIELIDIYAGLKAWRDERRLTAESQKEGYLINIMEELGELAQALRDYEKFSKPDYHCPTDKQEAEHEIIDALCDIAVFTINAGADIQEVISYLFTKPKGEISVAAIYIAIAGFIGGNKLPAFGYDNFAFILIYCASVCESYGYDFEIAMDETIKEISSRTGSYDEKAKKWVKDESDEAKAKWYSANYELARIKQ